MAGPIQYLPKTIHGGIFLCVIIITTSFFLKDTLPSSSEILPTLQQDPLQTETTREPFSFNYRDEEYYVQPVAEYELWGLVVSHNNIESLADIYHDENSVDLKDLCVVWGKNVENDNFHQMSFENGSWTCYWDAPNQSVLQSFEQTQLSNNHLIAPDKTVQEIIRNIHVGDQIYLKGMLVNYQHKNTPTWWRKSSTTREDTGNTACEVVLVEEVEILQSANDLWNNIFLWSKKVLLFLIGSKIFLFFWHNKNETEEFEKRTQHI